jgi:hypothetical protein
MKKILILFIALAFIACQRQPVKSRYVPVNTSTPNSGLGDNLYVAFQKVNAGFVDVYDSLGNIYTEAQSDQAIVDYVDDIIAAAEVGIVSADSTITTEGGYLSGYDSKTVGIRQSDLPLGPNDIINLVYYVNNDGDDDYDGLSPGSAWAHHPWMSTYTGSVTLEAGDVVCMKRGDTWTIADPVAPYMTVGQSGTANNYIVTTAYGVGEKPIIKISTNTQQPVIKVNGTDYLIFNDLHVQHNSSTYSGYYNLSGFWIGKNDADVPHDIIITNCEIDDIPFVGIVGYDDSYNITIGDTLAIETATSSFYSNHIHDFGYAGVLLMGCDPVSEESHFKVYYNYIHDCTRAEDNGYGISFTASVRATGWPKYVYARYNRVENIDIWSGISTHGGEYIYIQDNYIKRFGGVGIAAHDAAVEGLTEILNYVYIDRNIIEQPQSGWITGNEDSFIHVFADVDIDNDIYIRDNIIRYSSAIPASNLFNGISVASIDGLCIDNNKIYNSTAQTSSVSAMILNGSGSGILNVEIKNNYITNWGGHALQVYGDYLTGDLSIHNNVINSTENGTITITNILDAAANIEIYNNVLLNSSAVYRVYYITGTAVGSSVVIKNNIIGFTTSLNRSYHLFTADPLGTFASDYNLYWNSSAASPFYYSGAARTMDVWRATYSFDANTPNADLETLDPLFKNAGGSYLLQSDFDLQTTSPCIDAGVDVAIDYLGTAPDIGAIEKR